MVDTDASSLRLPIRDLIIYLNKEKNHRSETENNFSIELYNDAIELLIQKIKETEVASNYDIT